MLAQVSWDTNERQTGTDLKVVHERAEIVGSHRTGDFAAVPDHFSHHLTRCRRRRNHLAGQRGKGGGGGGGGGIDWVGGIVCRGEGG